MSETIVSETTISEKTRINTKRNGQHVIIHPETNADVVILSTGETLSKYIADNDKKLADYEKQIRELTKIVKKLTT